MLSHEEFMRKHAEPKPGWRYRVLPEHEARAVREQSPQHNAHRLPPAEYTRILLRAKDGDIAPGKADTLIHKLGGPIRVRPIPRPPR